MYLVILLVDIWRDIINSLVFYRVYSRLIIVFLKKSNYQCFLSFAEENQIGKRK